MSLYTASSDRAVGEPTCHVIVTWPIGSVDRTTRTRKSEICRNFAPYCVTISGCATSMMRSGDLKSYIMLKIQGTGFWTHFWGTSENRQHTWMHSLLNRVISVHLPPLPSFCPQFCSRQTLPPLCHSSWFLHRDTDLLRCYPTGQLSTYYWPALTKSAKSNNTYSWALLRIHLPDLSWLYLLVLLTTDYPLPHKG